MKPLKIIILNADITAAGMLTHFLADSKIASECTVVATKKNFLSALQELHPDVIISDHAIPELDAASALSMARASSPGIAFIVVADSTSEAFVADIMKLGADDYIPKEKINRLPNAIEEAVHWHKAEKDMRQILKKLKISEANYHTVFLKSPLPKWIYDCETLAFLEVNEAAVEKYGYTREEFLKMSLKDIRPREDVEKLIHYFEKVKLAPDFRQSLWRHQKKDGQTIIVETNAHTITYNNREARLVIINDVTERKKAEQKVLQSETNLKIIFDNTSEGFLLLDNEAKIMAFNNKAEQYTLFTKTKEFQLGHSIYDCIEPKRKNYFKSVIEKVLKGKGMQYDRSFFNEDNEMCWFEFSVTPVVVAQHIKGICITGRDITQKKLAEQEREFDRNNLKALINNTHDLMWSIDRKFKLITSNEAFDNAVKAISGDTFIKGNNVMEGNFTKERLNQFKAFYERVFAGESFTEIEYYHAAENYWSDISFYPIYNATEIIGAACFSRDVTWRKQAEEERLEYIKSLEEMLFRISHQVRVPIANLLGIALIAKDTNHTDDELKNIMGFINPTIATLDEFSKELTQFIEAILSKKKSSENKAS